MCICYKNVHAKYQSFSILLIDMTFLNLEIPPSPLFKTLFKTLMIFPAIRDLFSKIDQLITLHDFSRSTNHTLWCYLICDLAPQNQS